MSKIHQSLSKKTAGDREISHLGRKKVQGSKFTEGSGQRPASSKLIKVELWQGGWVIIGAKSKFGIANKHK
jgi:hypothetical protein